jgi:hypothetical protein
MKHDKDICTDDNRTQFLLDCGWQFWPDGSITKDGLYGRFDLKNAFEREVAGLKLCPVCGSADFWKPVAG